MTITCRTRCYCPPIIGQHRTQSVAPFKFQRNVIFSPEKNTLVTHSHCHCCHSCCSCHCPPAVLVTATKLSSGGPPESADRSCEPQDRNFKLPGPVKARPQPCPSGSGRARPPGRVRPGDRPQPLGRCNGPPLRRTQCRQVNATGATNAGSCLTHREDGMWS